MSGREAEMAGLSVPEKLPPTWVNRWMPIWQASREREEQDQYGIEEEVAQQHFPTTFMDGREDVPAQPRRESISRQNRETAVLVRRFLLPSPIRQAFPMERYRSPFLGLFDLLHESGSSNPSRREVLQTPRGSIIL